MMERVRLVVSTGEKNYIYTGIIIKDVDGWLTFNDERDGTIELNKNQIISIKHLGGGG